MFIEYIFLIKEFVSSGIFFGKVLITFLDLKIAYDIGDQQ